MKQSITYLILKSVGRTVSVLSLLLFLTASAYASAPICNAEFQHYTLTNPDSVHFYPSMTGSGVKYIWAFGDRDSSDNATPWHQYADSGTYTVCLIVTDSTSAGKCTSRFCDTVHVAGLPAPNCSGVHFAFYAAPGNADSIYFYAYIPTGTTASYSWNFGDGSNASTQPHPWHLYARGGTYRVCLTATVANTAGVTCVADTCDSVHVGSPPPPPPICNAHFQFYTASGNADSLHFYVSTNIPTGTDYVWNFGDGDTSHSPYPWHLYAHNGVYNVCLTVVDSTLGGVCSATWCDTVHVGPPPPICNAHFVFYSLNANADSVHFYVTPANASGTRYSWSFGDGHYSTEPSPWHFYANHGAYDVCLIVTDTTAGGVCSDTWCDSIHVQGPPPPVCNAHFQFYTLIQNPDSAHFYSSTAASTSEKYTWSFGDNSPVSHNADPWHLYTHPGAYYVCLTVTDSTAGGTCSDSWCDSIHIEGPSSPTCNAQFKIIRPTSGSLSNLVYFVGAINPPGTIYSWSFGDGSSGTDSITSHTYTHSGTYDVCLTVTNTRASCTTTWCDSVHITGPPPPVCNAHFVHYSLSANADSVHFYVTPANATGAIYTWTFGDGSPVSHNNDPWHLFAHAGAYDVCLTVTDSTAGGKCSDTWCDSIHIVGPPPPNCNAHFQFYSLTNPDSVHFYSSTAASTTTKYLWTFGDGDTSMSRYPWHYFATPGTYDVCLTVNDSNAGGTCTNTWCDSVHVGPPPPVCNAHFTHVSANATNTVIHFVPAPNAHNATYSWNFGDQSALSSAVDPTHVYANAGVYWVCLTVSDTTNSGFCSTTWCDSVHIGIPSIPCNAHFEFRYAYPGNVLYFIGAPNAPGTNYSWDFGDGDTSRARDVRHEFTAPGTYWVCLTVVNTATSCRATWCDSIHIEIFHPQVCNSNFYFKPGQSPHSLYFLSAPNTPSTKYLWTFGDGDSATTADAYHQYATGGTYVVCLTVRDTVSLCSDTRCLTLGPFRLANGGSTTEANASGDANVTIYPNPMTENAVVHIANMSGVVTFKMYDNMGRLVRNVTDLTNGDSEISKQGLSAGLYFYEVSDENNNVLRGKLIIQ